MSRAKHRRQKPFAWSIRLAVLEISSIERLPLLQLLHNAHYISSSDPPLPFNPKAFRFFLFISASSFSSTLCLFFLCSFFFVRYWKSTLQKRLPIPKGKKQKRRFAREPEPHLFYVVKYKVLSERHSRSCSRNLYIETQKKRIQTNTLIREAVWICVARESEENIYEGEKRWSRCVLGSVVQQSRHEESRVQLGWARRFLSPFGLWIILPPVFRGLFKFHKFLLKLKSRTARAVLFPPENSNGSVLT